MQLTNNFGYPEAVVNAARRMLHRPEEGFYGVTSVVDAPLVRHLRMTRWDDLTVDVDDLLIPMFGTAWHQFLERNTSERAELSWAFQTRGITLRGTTDLYRETNNGTIDDYKVVSAWSFVFGVKEWEQQLNLYALLARMNGYPISNLYIDAFIKDWSEWEAMKSKKDGYPDKRFFRIGIPLWTPEQQDAYLNARLDVHLAEPVECSPSEKWQSDTTFAVMKPGRKTAMRVLPSEDAAYSWISEQKNKKDLYVNTRKGECKRCNRFCSVRSVCPYAEAT